MVDGAGVWRSTGDHAAAVPAGARRARHAAVHLDVQRLPLGAGLHLRRRQAAHHLGAEQSRGQFFTDYNLLAAGSVIVALPTLIVFLLLQRHFIAA